MPACARPRRSQPPPPRASHRPRSRGSSAQRAGQPRARARRARAGRSSGGEHLLLPSSPLGQRCLRLDVLQGGHGLVARGVRLVGAAGDAVDHRVASRVVEEDDRLPAARTETVVPRHRDSPAPSRATPSDPPACAGRGWRRGFRSGAGGRRGAPWSARRPSARASPPAAGRRTGPQRSRSARLGARRPRARRPSGTRSRCRRGRPPRPPAGSRPRCR